jgi:hypothetical protein
MNVGINLSKQTMLSRRKRDAGEHAHHHIWQGKKQDRKQKRDKAV